MKNAARSTYVVAEWRGKRMFVYWSVVYPSLVSARRDLRRLVANDPAKFAGAFPIKVNDAGEVLREYEP